MIQGDFLEEAVSWGRTAVHPRDEAEHFMGDCTCTNLMPLKPDGVLFRKASLLFGRRRFWRNISLADRSCTLDTQSAQQCNGHRQYHILQHACSFTDLPGRFRAVPSLASSPSRKRVARLDHRIRPGSVTLPLFPRIDLVFLQGGLLHRRRRRQQHCQNLRVYAVGRAISGLVVRSVSSSASTLSHWGSISEMQDGRTKR